jgi:hypothetical protein
VLARERERDPEGFRSEYLAEFVGGGAAYLDPERVADAVADRGELLPDQATGWVAGLDPGFASDPLGLALVGRVPPDLTQLPATLPAPPDRLVLGLARAWKPARHKATSFEERRAVEDRVVAEVADVCLRYRAAVVTDQYLAPAVVDALRRRGLDVWATPMTAASKTAAFGELRARLYGGTPELYPEPTLIAELRRLRARHAAGQASVVNPGVGGSHGDLAQALALAVLAHGTGRVGAPGEASAEGYTAVRDLDPDRSWLRAGVML